MPTSGRTAVIVGAGPPAGIGGATALHFARQGYRVFAAGRNIEKMRELLEQAQKESLQLESIALDATDDSAVTAMFEKIAADTGSIDFALHNVGGNFPKATLEMSAKFMEDMWRNTCLAGMLVGNAVLKSMQQQGQGTLMFTGASASLRGKPLFAGFAMAKAGLRAYAQACAREFAPQGVHVAHLVIDGAVDGDRLQNMLPEWLEQLGDEGSLQPTAIAESIWQVHQQPRSAWTHEMDLRPFKENF